MNKCLLVFVIILTIISLFYLAYRKSKTIDKFTQSSDIVDQVQKLITPLFVETNFNKEIFKSKLKLVLEQVITFSVDNQKVLLRMVNQKYKDVKTESIKTQIETVYQTFIDEYMENSIDISCILNASSCDATQMKGTCGTLATKLKLAMSKESELKKYKEFVEDLKDLMEPLNESN